MRLWSIHPGYLDAKGLVALWREGLLALNVLQGKTTGYRHHPQLTRFRAARNPVGAIARYLRGVADEADLRGYNFDRGKIPARTCKGKISVTSGQQAYEFAHLLGKLATRDPELHSRWKTVKTIEPHPLFQETPGKVEDWEVT